MGGRWSCFGWGEGCAEVVQSQSWALVWKARLISVSRTITGQAQMLREGSSWRRWDLHIHAPTTALNNQFPGSTFEEKWNPFLAAVEASGEYGALGITDYMSVEGYRAAVRFKEQGRLKGVSLLLPNIEMRILPVTEKAKAINLHLIVCPSIVDDIESLFFNNLDFEYGSSHFKCVRNDLVRLGREFSGDKQMAEEGAYRIGVGQFKVSFEQVSGVLKKNKRLRDYCLVGLANGQNDGGSGIRDSGLAAVQHEFYRLADFILSSKPGDVSYFLGRAEGNPPDTIRKRYGSIKPCLSGCDAHDLERIGKAEQDRFTWVRADPTFEGLRQVTFEPDSRVSIGATPPPIPVHWVKRVSLDFPTDTTLKWDEAEVKFCFAGSTSLALAPGFTCLIGGRGAGKSTLVNLLAERLKSGSSEYLSDHKLRSEGRTLGVADHVDVDLAGDNSTVEFIPQNEVERFARDPARLTDAVYSRLLSQEGGASLEQAERSARSAVESADERISLIRRRAVISAHIADLERRVAGLKTLLMSYADPVFTETTEKLRESAGEQSQLSRSRDGLAVLVTRLRGVLDSEPAEVEAVNNDFVSARSVLVSDVQSAIGKAVGDSDLSKPGERERVLAIEIQKHSATLREFLASRGLSEENLRDISSASQQVAEAEALLQDRNAELERINADISLALIDPSKRAAFEEQVRAAVAALNGRFSSGHKEIRRLELKYTFDLEAASQSAIGWLQTQLTEAFPMARIRSDHVENVLERAGDVLTCETADLIAAISEDGSKTAQCMDAYFGVDANRLVWEAVRKRHLADVTSYMRLHVLYDGKPLESTSFGQRCSAVLIVLLSLGNSPIIIDEPEAHLDSGLIAGFLVDMVKRVKSHRQIIFATHNANFVVNGDADLIHVLRADGQQSVVESTTLEDLEKRHLVLALEGGEEAFRQREGRYRLM